MLITMLVVEHTVAPKNWGHFVW